MNYDGVYRTAPATPGLSIKEEDNNCKPLPASSICALIICLELVAFRQFLIILRLTLQYFFLSPSYK